MNARQIERLDAILTDAMVEAEDEALQTDGLETYAELLRAAAGMPDRVDGFVDWARARAKELDRIARRLETLAKDRGPHR